MNYLLVNTIFLKFIWKWLTLANMTLWDPLSLFPQAKSEAVPSLSHSKMSLFPSNLDWEIDSTGYEEFLYLYIVANCEGSYFCEQHVHPGLAGFSLHFHRGLTLTHADQKGYAQQKQNKHPGTLVIVTRFKEREEKTDFSVSMDKHFLLLLPVVCCIVAVTPLRCITCHLRTQTDRCRRGFGVCVAEKHETCMILKVFQDNILQLSYMVCQRFCRELTYKLNDRTYVHTCCNYNYLYREW
ncbi:hypothetical protein E2I00_011630 [Balaenoptera physalus]|uniref:UPAR/Ly6 domain-containing protein n=1 Tax=Balaenoptera physalus TaxID=9770 RepID=A0A643CJU2_BALPH|nr:hypothetical protein E2I00_011630 [Balaenoptera physalus]